MKKLAKFADDEIDERASSLYEIIKSHFGPTQGSGYKDRSRIHEVTSARENALKSTFKLPSIQSEANAQIQVAQRVQTLDRQRLKACLEEFEDPTLESEAQKAAAVWLTGYNALNYVLTLNRLCWTEESIGFTKGVLLCDDISLDFTKLFLLKRLHLNPAHFETTLQVLSSLSPSASLEIVDQLIGMFSLNFSDVHYARLLKLKQSSVRPFQFVHALRILFMSTEFTKLFLLLDAGANPCGVSIESEVYECGDANIHFSDRTYEKLKLVPHTYFLKRDLAEILKEFGIEKD